MQHIVKSHATNLSNSTSPDTVSTPDSRQQIHAILDIDVTKPISNQWVPAVDISETNDRFIIQADLPGIKTSDVEVKLRNGVLTFKGQRATKNNNSLIKNYFRLERASGTFSRRFSLPDSVNSEIAKVSSDHGVLTITIPKKIVAKANKHSAPSTIEKVNHDKSTSHPHTAPTRLMSNYWG